jgi:hypothetical protein
MTPTARNDKSSHGGGEAAVLPPAPMKIGSGWCVQVTLPSGINPKLGGFKTEEEAREWIARKSAEWLKQYEGGRYA